VDIHASKQCLRQKRTHPCPKWRLASSCGWSNIISSRWTCIISISTAALDRMAASSQIKAHHQPKTSLFRSQVAQSCRPGTLAFLALLRAIHGQWGQAETREPQISSQPDRAFPRLAMPSSAFKTWCFNFDAFARNMQTQCFQFVFYRRLSVLAFSVISSLLFMSMAWRYADHSLHAYFRRPSRSLHYLPCCGVGRGAACIEPHVLPVPMLGNQETTRVLVFPARVLVINWLCE